MGKNFNESSERRKYIRLFTPISVVYTNLTSGKMHNAGTKDISADGMRFQATDKALKASDIIELKLNIPDADNPVHAKGRVMWRDKLTLADNSPFDFGIEFIEIEEDNKNTFLRFLCDLIYNLPGEEKNENKDHS